MNYTSNKFPQIVLVLLDFFNFVCVGGFCRGMIRQGFVASFIAGKHLQQHQRGHSAEQVAERWKYSQLNFPGVQTYSCWSKDFPFPLVFFFSREKKKQVNAHKKS